MYVQIIELKIPSVDAHMNAPHISYVSSSLVGESEEQLLTHHDRNKSVAVSTVVNKANTIQYIIHFTWTHTDTHTDTQRSGKIIKIAMQTPHSVQLARAGTRGAAAGRRVTYVVVPPHHVSVHDRSAGDKGNVGHCLN